MGGPIIHQGAKLAAARAMPYHRRMKTSYIFGAILVCSIAGTLMGARSGKTALLVVSGVLAGYGLFRILG